MKKIRSLDETLNNIQINRFLDKAEKELNKITKRLRKQILITIIPMLVIIINAFTLQNFYIMLLGLTAIYGIGIVAGVKDLIKSVRGKNSKEEIYLDNLKFTKINPEEYYTLEYKRAIANYTPTVEDNLEVIDNSFLNKEAAINQVVAEIECYTQVYRLPALDLSDASWDKLFDVLYGLFVAKKREEVYYDALSDLVRQVLAKALLDKEAVITIDNFIANIDILKSYGLSDDDIEYVKDELSLDLKVVDFNTLVRKNKRDISRH